MDQTVVTLREKIFGARDLTTQDVIDHFLGNVAMAEAYLNGLIDWAARPIVSVKTVTTHVADIAQHFQSDKLAELYLAGLIDWDGVPACYLHGSAPCNCLYIDF